MIFTEAPFALKLSHHAFYVLFNAVKAAHAMSRDSTAFLGLAFHARYDRKMGCPNIDQLVLTRKATSDDEILQEALGRSAKACYVR